ncbi:unnamed protein product [Clavelina lepadiformis]|uniref:Sugar transporter SWEET1 n=1 Tax=Clavelina lepadiformis TaxID=159417 RepID=A0ABP0GWQ2_CLALP
MIHWLNIASNGCIFFTIVMFATGIPQCLQMIKTKSTKNITFLPYLMTNINNVSWIVYGQMTENFTIIFVNVVGSILQTIYMSVFVYFSTTKNREIQQTSLSAITAVVVWFISTQMVNDAEFSIYIVGIVSCCITMLMFSSPLAEINTVLKNRSTSTISFPLTVASFLCATSWFLYGLLLKDFFIVIPNSVGILTSIARFYLFYMYPQEKSAVLPM